MRTQQLVALITLFCISCNSVETKNIQKAEPKGNDGPVVVYNLSGTEDAIVKMDIPYRTHGDSNLVMDIYYPPNFNFESKTPAVVIVFGYSDEAQNRIIGKQFRKWSWYTSWCRLIAASGLAAIVYETSDPVDDLAAVEKFIKENETELLIDKDNVGAFAVSANTPTAISNLLDDSNDFFKCGVFYYGFTLTSDSKYLNPIDSLYKNWGFSIARIQDSAHWNLDAPIMLVRAGKDKLAYLNKTNNEFMNMAMKKNLPVTLINYTNGLHGFDAYNDNDTTRMIVKRTIEFWRFYLQNANSN